MDKLLIKGGRVLPISSGRAELKVDILIEDGRIASLAPDIDVDAELVRADGCIVIPGFVDTHRHVWQTQLRTAATDWSLFDYFVRIRFGYAKFYTAEDAYLGNLVGALEALDCGITTLVDHCHIINSPEHGEEAVRGLKEAGIRAIFCNGTFANEPDVTAGVTPADPSWRYQAAQRLRKGPLSSDDALVRFGFAPSEAEAMPFKAFKQEIAFARGQGATSISCHVAQGAYNSGRELVRRLGAESLLGPDLLFVHGASLTDVELDLIRDAGAGVSATPETELQMGMGFPVAHRARAHGVRVGLGVDIVSNYAGDMFLPMRLGLQATRAARNLEFETRNRAPAKIHPDAFSVLRMATLGGAEAIHYDAQIGSIEVGKRADLAIIRTDSIHMTPTPDAVGAVVLNARPSDIDTVVVEGHVVKRNGRLERSDWPALRQRVLASSERIRAAFLGLDIAVIEVKRRALIANLE
jgi:cytosine/adenosine deaminase-related metal-dependent hydrolase